MMSKFAYLHLELQYNTNSTNVTVKLKVYNKQIKVTKFCTTRYLKKYYHYHVVFI